MVSFLGDAWGLVALIVYVAGTGHGGAGVGGLLLAGDFVPALASPILGVVAGRLPARAAMVGCELGQAVTLAAIVLFQPPLPVILVLVAVQSLVATVFQATSRSVVPDLVADDDLERANALLGAGTYGLEALGPLLAAAFVALVDPRGALGLDVVTFLVSAALLAGLPGTLAAPAPPGPEPADRDQRILREAATVLRWMWDDRVVRLVALGFFAVVAFTAVDDVALVFLGTRTFHTGGAGAGLLYAGSGVGLLVGFVLLARARSDRARPVRTAVLGFGLASAGNLLTGAAPVLGLAFATQAVRGAGVSMIDVGTNTAVQRRTPPALRAQVFANVSGIVGLAAGISYLAGGALVDASSPRTVFLVAGAGGLVATVVVAARLAAFGRSSRL